MAAIEVRMRELARTVPPGDVQLYYQTLLIGRKELPYAPDRRMGVEMTLLRALAFHPRMPLPEPEVQPRTVRLRPSPHQPVMTPTQVPPQPHQSPQEIVPLPMPPARCWRRAASCSAAQGATKAKKE